MSPTEIAIVLSVFAAADLLVWVPIVCFVRDLMASLEGKTSLVRKSRWNQGHPLWSLLGLSAFAGLLLMTSALALAVSH